MRGHTHATDTSARIDERERGGGRVESFARFQILLSSKELNLSPASSLFLSSSHPLPLSNSAFQNPPPDSARDLINKLHVSGKYNISAIRGEFILQPNNLFSGKFNAGYRSIVIL